MQTLADEQFAQAIRELDTLAQVMTPEEFQATLCEMKDHDNRTATYLWLAIQHAKGK